MQKYNHDQHHSTAVISQLQLCCREQSPNDKQDYMHYFHSDQHLHTGAL